MRSGISVYEQSIDKTELSLFSLDLNRSNIHHPIHRSLLLAPNLSQMDTVHAVTTYFLKTCFNNIFQVVPSSSNWPLRLPTKNSHNFLIASVHALRNPFDPSRVYHCNSM